MGGRIKQFLNHLRYHGQEIDGDFLKKHLDSSEIQLFQRLQKAEQVHSVRVAKILQREAAPCSSTMVKMALFHDIGKIHRPLSLPEKVLAVVLTRVLGRGSKPLRRWSFMEAHLEHGPWGAKILEARGILKEDPLLYDVVRHHHVPLESFRKDANYPKRFHEIRALLKKADDMEEA